MESSAEAARGAAPRDVAAPGRRRRFAGLRRFLRTVRDARGVPKWLLYSGVAIVVVFVVLAIFAPLIAPYGFAQFSAEGARFPKQGAPSAEHLFGTTVQATDVLSRVIWGARTAIQVVLLAVVFSLVAGVPLGLISGYMGGKLDRALVLVMDALFAFPYLLLAIIIAFLLSDTFGQGVVTAAVAITVVYVPQYFRVVRNHVISVREEPYVEAARALGAKRRTIIGRYVFYNVIQNVPPIATLNAADAVLTLAALGFLGYGIQPTEAAEWGYDLQRAIADAGAGIWWTGLFPGLAIVLLVTGFTLVGEGLNDVLNPLIRHRRIRRPQIPAAASPALVREDVSRAAGDPKDAPRPAGDRPDPGGEGAEPGAPPGARADEQPAGEPGESGDGPPPRPREREGGAP